MEWQRKAVYSLARPACAVCGGEGVKKDLDGQIVPCHCVLRAVFRACYARFRVCAGKEKHLTRVSMEHVGGRDHRTMWGRKDEEYVADFHLTGRRVLDPLLYRVFSYHFLLGADWRLCCRRLRVDRGQFFHLVYRVMEGLGRVFYEMKPYPLFPPREYFVTRVTRRPSRPLPFQGRPYRASPPGVWAS